MPRNDVQEGSELGGGRGDWLRRPTKEEQDPLHKTCTLTSWEISQDRACVYFQIGITQTLSNPNKVCTLTHNLYDRE